MEQFNVVEYMRIKYNNRTDRENIYGVGITKDEFIKMIVEYLLGHDYYVADPIGQNQVLEVEMIDILTKYSERFRREIKQYRKENW